MHVYLQVQMTSFRELESPVDLMHLSHTTFVYRDFGGNSFSRILQEIDAVSDAKPVSVPDSEGDVADMETVESASDALDDSKFYLDPPGTAQRPSSILETIFSPVFQLFRAYGEDVPARCHSNGMPHFLSLSCLPGCLTCLAFYWYWSFCTMSIDRGVPGALQLNKWSCRSEELSQCRPRRREKPTQW